MAAKLRRVCTAVAAEKTQESARAASVSSIRLVQVKAASVQSVKLRASAGQQATVTDSKKKNRVLAARIRRMSNGKEREVPKPFTGVRPDQNHHQIADSALELLA